MSASGADIPFTAVRRRARRNDIRYLRLFFEICDRFINGTGSARQCTRSRTWNYIFSLILPFFSRSRAPFFSHRAARHHNLFSSAHFSNLMRNCSQLARSPSACRQRKCVCMRRLGGNQRGESEGSLQWRRRGHFLRSFTSAHAAADIHRFIFIHRTLVWLRCCDRTQSFGSHERHTNGLSLSLSNESRNGKRREVIAGKDLTFAWNKFETDI